MRGTGDTVDDAKSATFFLSVVAIPVGIIILVLGVILHDLALRCIGVGCLALGVVLASCIYVSDRRRQENERRNQ